MQQEHVTGAKPNGAEAGLRFAVGARQGQQIDAIALVHLQAAHGLPFDRGVGHDHHLGHADGVRAQLFSLDVHIGYGLELGRAKQRFQGHGVSFEDQQVAGLNAVGAMRCQDTGAAADDGHHRHLVLAERLQLAYLTPDQGGFFGYLGLDEIGFDVKACRLGDVTYRTALLRQEAPADEANEGKAGQGHREADRGEIEHAKGFAAVFGAKTRDDDVRRCPDEGDEPAQQGGKRERHEDRRGRAPGLCGMAQRHGQHQGKRPNVIHEGGKHHTQTAGRTNLQCGCAPARAKQANQKVDDAGNLKGPADDQNSPDGDDRRVSKSHESMIGRDDACKDGRKQCQERHQIVAPAAPDEEHHGRDQH